MPSKIFSLLFSLVLISFFFFQQVTTVSAVGYNGGTYTNLCGTGTAATALTCNRGCNANTGTCQSNQAYVVKFTCDGRQTECRSNESAFSTSQSIGNPGCGKTVQIDVFNKKCRTADGGWSCNNGDLQDYMVWYSGDCSQTPASTSNPTPVSPTPSPKPPTPTPQPQHKSQCESLSVVGGNDSLVPAKVTLRAKGSDNLGNIQAYKFYFGDGKIEESTNPEINHTYEASGNFTARVDVKDSKGNWKTSTACETTVRVKSAPVESHKSGCSDVTWTTDNSSQAPTTVKFQVYGYDNKGTIPQYKLDFGNGVVKEGNGREFEQRYETAGTYTIKAFIKDSQGNWKGGDNNCQRNLYINTKPLTEQPKTGTPTFFTVAAALSGLSGVGTYFVAKRKAK